MALTRDLSVHWQQTRETWTDAKRDEFERRFLDGLFAAVERAGTSLEKLDDIVTKTRRDCE